MVTPPDAFDSPADGPENESSDDFFEAPSRAPQAEPSAAKTPPPAPADIGRDESDDFFTAPSPNTKFRPASSAAPPPPVIPPISAAKDAHPTASESGAHVPAIVVAPGADLASERGIGFLRAVEPQLEEVPECGNPLLKILDGFTPYSAENFRAGIIEYATLADEYLARWDVAPKPLDTARFNRLKATGEGLDALGDAVDDLKVTAQYLAQVRPEDMFDAGSWGLYRDVRRAIRHDDVEFVATITAKLNRLVDGDSRHWLAPYLDRLDERYAKLIATEIQRLAGALAVEADTTQPEPVAKALVTLDAAAVKLDGWHQIYPHESLAAALQKFAAKRATFTPTLARAADEALKLKDLGRIGGTLRAIDILVPNTPSAREMAPKVADLTALRDSILDAARQTGQTALATAEPGPIFDAIATLTALPARERPADLNALMADLEAAHADLLADLEAAIFAALKSKSPDDVAAALRRLKAYAEHNPKHPLAGYKGELAAHRELLLARLAKEQQVRDAYDSLSTQVENVLGDARATANGVRDTIRLLAGNRLVPDDLKLPLRERLEARAARLAALEAALAADEAEVAGKHLAHAKAGISADDRAILAANLEAASTHVAELSDIAAHLAALHAVRQEISRAENLAPVAESASAKVATAREFLAAPATTQPAAEAPRAALEREVAAVQSLVADLENLATVAADARVALGVDWQRDPATMPALDRASGTLTARMEAAGKALAVAQVAHKNLAHAHAQIDRAHTLAGDWHAIADRVQSAIDAGKCNAVVAAEAQSLAANPLTPDDRAAIEGADDWLSLDGKLLNWFEARTSGFVELAGVAESAATELVANRRRMRNRLLAAVVGALLIAAGIFAFLQWQEMQRQQRAQDLLADAEAASQADQSASTGPVLIAVDEFLGDATNRADFDATLGPAREKLDARHRLLAALEAREAAVKAAAEAAIQSKQELQSALDGVVNLQTETPLPAQKSRLEPLRIALHTAMLEKLAAPGISADTLDAVTAAREAVKEAVDARNDPPVTAAAQPLLDALDTRARTLKLEAARALVAPDKLADEAATDAAIAALRARREAETDPAVRAELDRMLALLDARKNYFTALREIVARLNAVLAATDPVEKVATDEQSIRADADAVTVPEGLPAVAEKLAPEFAAMAKRRTLLTDANAAKKLRTSADVQAAIAALRNELSAPEGRIHANALRPHLQELMQLAQRLQASESDRDRQLAALVARGKSLLGEERVAPIDEYFADAKPVADSIAGEIAAPLRAVIGELEARKRFVEEKIARGQALTAQGESAVAGTDAAAVAKAIADIRAYVADAPLSWQVPPLMALVEQLAVANVTLVERPGLASENATEIAAVEAKVADLANGENVPAAVTDAVAKSRSRLSRRHQFFATRDTIRARTDEILTGTERLAAVKTAQTEVRESIEKLLAAPRTAETFGAEPKPDAALEGNLTAIATRISLLQQAADGMHLRQSAAVDAVVAELETALQTAAGSPHREALKAPIAELKWLAEFLRAFEAGLKKGTADDVRAVIADLKARLAQPIAEPVRGALADQVKKLEEHAEALATVLSMSVPADTVEATVNFTGKIERGVKPEQVYLIVNGGEPQPLAVDVEGGFSAEVSLAGGANAVVVSPTVDAAHAGAARATVTRYMPAITLSGPNLVDSRYVTMKGTLAGAPLPMVFVFVNGDMQRAEVVDGKFEVVVIVRSGENEIVASPAQRIDHPAAVKHAIMSNVARSAVVITLTWEEEGPDVDLRVVQPNGITVSWQKKKPGGLNGVLDVDDTDGLGPECYTFSLQPGEKLPAGTYRVFIVYYQGDRPVNWTLRVKINEGMPNESIETLTGRVDMPNKDRPVQIYEFTVDE